MDDDRERGQEATGPDRRPTGDRPDPRAVEEAFAELSGVSATEREAGLARLREVDARLADEIASLLSHHVELPAEETAEAEVPTFALTGQSIGGCRIGRLIGAGGMSAVYEATQDFPRRQVAVKVVRRERMSGWSALRLRIEAEALARLAHPNIARVYSAGSFPLPEADGGTAGRETPYLVLELIEDAVGVTEWADARGLSPVERIELLATVADALDHAHRAGVIHRDLKPGNVIVGRDGVPKVIDFGIAAVADAEEDGASAGAMGTILYMSPELAGGGAVDTRSDVWGLGALLHDLLAGTPPFPITDESMAMRVARLLREPPPAVTLAARERRDRGFLAAIPPATDAVVAKALAPDSDRRYRSATEFADELRRLVKGDPLLASPDSRLDALRRTFRRHRTPVLAVAGVALATVAGLAWSLVLLGRERDANGRAEWHTYAAAIAAAGGMIERADASAARHALGRAPERLRNWEWHHLAGRVDQAVWSVGFPPKEQVYGLDFSADGERLLVAAGSRAAAIDIPGRRMLWMVETHAQGACWRVKALPDGGGVFVRLDRQIERLDAKGAVAAIAAEPGVTEIALDRTRTRLFSDAPDGFTIRDAKTLAVLRAVKADPPLPGPPSTLLLTPDERRVALGVSTGAIVALDAETGGTAWTSGVPGSSAEVRGLAISPDGSLVAAVALGHVVLIDARDGTIVWHRTIAGRSFRSPSFTPDGRELLLATWQETIDRLAVADGRTIGSVSGIFSQVWVTAPSPDGRTFAASGLSGRVGIFPLDATNDPPAIELDGSAVESVALGRGSSAGVAFATTAAGSLWRIDLATDATERLDRGLEAGGVAVAADGSIAVGHSRGIAWISRDGGILEDVPLPEPVDRLSLPDPYHVFAVCETAGTLANAFIVRKASGTAGAATWALQPRGFDCGAACPTARPGEFFVPAGHGGISMSVRIADESGRPLDPPLTKPLDDQPEYPLAARLSPDGSTIAIGNVMNDGEVTLSDPSAFRQRINLPNHRGKVRSLAWSPDGARLASAGMDDTVRIWHVERGEEILVAWRGEAKDLAWGEDGTLWIACGDGRIRRLRSPVPSGRPTAGDGDRP